MWFLKLIATMLIWLLIMGGSVALAQKFLFVKESKEDNKGKLVNGCLTFIVIFAAGFLAIYVITELDISPFPLGTYDEYEPRGYGPFEY